MSFGSLPSGESVPFFHTHENNEENYIILSGSGKFQVNDSVFDISEGSVVRVSTHCDRCLKCTSDAPMLYLCIQAAKKKIATAKKYASMSPINNCTELVSRLNSVSTRLEQAHYSYLAGQVERLRPYYNYSQTEYDKIALSISEKFDEYKNNAKSTYGRVSDISSLESRAGSYYSNATFNN
ncbi:cupin domain-containing protein [Segatella copri]|uniref:cupin domain-containing protein n=1 Tax=Segatella copri TaxID=165179 RepID=UPI0025810823